jgi:hypothetical protein
MTVPEANHTLPTYACCHRHPVVDFIFNVPGIKDTVKPGTKTPSPCYHAAERGEPRTCPLSTLHSNPWTSLTWDEILVWDEHPMLGLDPGDYGSRQNPS